MILCCYVVLSYFRKYFRTVQVRVRVTCNSPVTTYRCTRAVSISGSKNLLLSCARTRTCVALFIHTTALHMKVPS